VSATDEPLSLPLSTGLTDAQRRAITHPGGPLLILAGAGTGKTTVLVERFAWLAAEGCAPESILALTFSATPADDLRERIEARVAPPYEELAVTTFQAFCAQLLRDEALE
jgi:DNA helicase II / ATP-dependent DNA helicase PcrA